MRVRPAEERDGADIFVWRNDLTTRRMSKNQGELLWDDHIVWFRRALSDPSKVFLIGEEAGGAFGMVRYDRRADGEWDVSISVGPAYRGRGKGSALLTNAEAALRGVHPGSITHAAVRRENSASAALFLSCGYAPSGDDGAFLYFRACPTEPTDSGRFSAPREDSGPHGT